MTTSKKQLDNSEKTDKVGGLYNYFGEFHVPKILILYISKMFINVSSVFIKPTSNVHILKGNSDFLNQYSIKIFIFMI